MKVFAVVLIMIFLERASTTELNTNNPVRINYDKHGTFLNIEVYCGQDEVDETTLAPTESTISSSTSTTEETTTSTVKSNGCDPCHNVTPGMKVYHHECLRFCVCEQNGGVTIKDCEFGLIFNNSTQKCEDPLLSDCPYTQWSR